jgi:protein ImuB
VLTAAPERFHTGSSSGWQQVQDWAGPWPVSEAGVLKARVQIVAVDGSAWLMRCDGSSWWTEASYD